MINHWKIDERLIDVYNRFVLPLGLYTGDVPRVVQLFGQDTLVIQGWLWRKTFLVHVVEFVVRKSGQDWMTPDAAVDEYEQQIREIVEGRTKGNGDATS